MRTVKSIFVASVVLILLVSVSGLIHAQSNVSACSGKATFASGMSEETIEAGDLTRSYLLYIPAEYDPSARTPVVFSLHGFASSAAQQVLWSQWNEFADTENFIVVYPQGTGSPARWNAGQHEITSAQSRAYRGPMASLLASFFETVPTDDVAFIRELIAHLSDQLCLDPTRIYVTGLSNGGGMTNRLACELSDQIAAIGTVAGAYTEFPGGCHPVRPVPVIAFHGVVDPIVPYEGNEQIHFPAIQTWAADWAARDSCDPTPEVIEGTVGAVSGIRYSGCAGNAEVDLYTISDGGHTWPGGFPIPAFLVGKTSEDIDATATMWEFFQAHPLE